MITKNILICVVVLSLFYGTSYSQKTRRGIPATKFACHGRASGYYADVETGCQVYHMCDGLGRQFSYTCPNTTLFQQRMLICDHWYMVNCSRSELDYDANLLIGQRDKPFVSDAEMSLRTPRPDILSVPPNNNYYDGLKEAETKFPVHPDNNIVGIGDTIASDNNGLDIAKHQYRPPSSWSTGTGVKINKHLPSSDDRNQQLQHSGNSGNVNHQFKHNTKTNGHIHHNIDDRFQQGNHGNRNKNHNTQASGSSNHEQFEEGESTNRPDRDNLTGAASQDTEPTFQPTPNLRPVTPPSRELSPPTAPKRESSEEFDLDVRMKEAEDPVYNFIKRFDPNSPDSHKTAMSASEILKINSQLPTNHDVSNEDERTPRRNKDIGNHFNILPTDSKGPDKTKFDAVNQKGTEEKLKVPERVLLPPKKDQSELPSTTMGPPIYYEWKWAVPAFDLEPPKQYNATQNNTILPRPTVKRPFSDVPRTTPKTIKVTQPNTEYNTSSYFVPDYIFPLDKEHPGYENDNAQTSFQVKVSRPGRASFGENPACPQCHPAYLEPGSCEPCIVKR